MQRIGNLFPAFCSFKNLLLAYRKARRGTRANEETAAFFFGLEPELLRLQEELLDGGYQPQPYRYFKIYDPKERTISVAPFRDRVVHHALVNVLEPIYERCFIHDSYATRKGKGTHAAIARAQGCLRPGVWYLKSDVDKFFDSIRHNTLLGAVERKIKDKRLLDVTARIINNGGIEGVGLPIGNLTSQFFANVYLNRFDHFVKQNLGVRHYIRYMDDVALFSKDKNELKAWRQAIEGYLDEHLTLRLKGRATFINSAENGLTFLGRRIFPGLVRLARPNLRHMVRRMAERKLEFSKGSIDKSCFLQSMNSYWALLQYGGNGALRNKLLKDNG